MEQRAWQPRRYGGQKTMKSKQKKIDRRIFKKEGEELQQWLAFRKRGGKVESGKRYNRQKFKRGE
jgi:hypothetical protein